LVESSPEVCVGFFHGVAKVLRVSTEAKVGADLL
jgi:hypothetical protein